MNSLCLLLFTCLFLLVICSTKRSHDKEPIITPKFFSTRIQSLNWVTPQRVFIVTLDGSFYRSEDGGFSWNEEIFKDTNKNIEPISRVYESTYHWSSKPESDAVVIVGRNGSCWFSNDQGETFSTAVRITETDSVSYLRYHPENSDWILFGTRDSQNILGGFNLWVTLDSGKSFKKVDMGISRFYWNNQDEENDKTIIYSKMADPTSQSRSYDLYTTKNLGVDIKQVISNVYDFSQSGSKTIAFVESGFNDGQLYIRISSDSNTFKPASFPYDKDPIYQRGYYLIPWISTDDSITVAIDHGSWANLYGSDASGLKYTLIEPHVSDLWRIVDYVEFSGLEGVVLVNTVFEEDYDEDDTGTDIPLMRKTKMSWDNGGEWHNLAPPKYNSLGQPIICTGECSLHLNGWTSLITRPSAGPFYSDESSIGLGMASGGIGEFLPSFDQLNTYFTRDGGVTWTEISQGSSTYEFGDQGGIIVMADNYNPVTTFKFSLDQGLNWEEVKFSDQAYNIENIQIERSNNARVFILTAIDPSNEASEAIFHLDFTNVFSRDCLTDDYEEWYPTDPYGGKQNCLLGRNTTYVRRKQDALCYNTQLDDTISSVNCECTEEDYECGYGFDAEYFGIVRFCVANGEVPIDVDETNCEPGKSYTLPSGYRKVPGDTCVGGVQFPDVTFVCPGGDDDDDNGGSGSSGLGVGIVILIIVIVLAFVAGLIAFVFRNPDVQDRIKCVEFPISIPFLYSPVRASEPSQGETEFQFGTDSDEENVSEPQNPIGDQSL